MGIEEDNSYREPVSYTHLKYYLVETKTIDIFVLDDTPIEADLSYIDQKTKVVFAGMEVTNERQKGQITVTKTDSETKKELEGAVICTF